MSSPAKEARMPSDSFHSARSCLAVGCRPWAKASRLHLIHRNTSCKEHHARQPHRQRQLLRRTASRCLRPVTRFKAVKQSTPSCLE
eukprot:10689735-Alexandrium_andersonii.AAC.1